MLLGFVLQDCARLSPAKISEVAATIADQLIQTKHICHCQKVQHVKAVLAYKKPVKTSGALLMLSLCVRDSLSGQQTILLSIG